MSTEVIWLRQSMEDERPNCVTYYDPDGWYQTEEGYEVFQRNAFVCQGKTGYSSDQWMVPDLYAPDRGSTRIDVWDYYMCEGTFGVFSPRAVETLAPCFGDRFELLAARLEGHPYYCLRCVKRVDCLDREGSKILFDDDHEVIEVEEYAFEKDRLADPLVFAIPELFLRLFCTESVPLIVGKAGLRGIDFVTVG